MFASSVSPRRSGRRARVLAFLFASACAVAPTLSVRRPPVLDLAPQVDQARLAISVLRVGREDLLLRPIAPNRISYPLLAVGWLLGGPLWGARLGLALCVVATVGSIHLLAASLRRPIAHALVATVFVASSSLYGGFFNFAVGSLGFVLWLRELQDPRAARHRPGILILRAAALGAVLAIGHVLWLGAALVTAGVGLTGPRRARRVSRLRLVGLAPLVALSLAWVASAPDPGWSRGAVWRTRPVERVLRPDLLATEMLGGVRGALEPTTLVLIGAWTASGLRPRRRRGLGRGGRRRLAVTGCLFLAAGVLLPTTFGDTTLFASRWLPWAAVFLVLAAPPPQLVEPLRRTLAAALLAGFFTATAVIWRGFEHEELAGLEAALGAVPTGGSLVTLDLRAASDRMRIAPYAHLGVYAVLERGARSARSFSDIPSSLVLSTGESGWSPPDHPRLERMRARRLLGFDAVLVHATPRGARAFARRFPQLFEVTGAERWFLFRPRRAVSG